MRCSHARLTKRFREEKGLVDVLSFVVVLFSVGASAASADPFVPIRTSVVQACLGPVNSFSGACAVEAAEGAPGELVTINETLATGDAALVASAAASAQYGSFSVRSQSTFDIDGPPTTAYTTAHARFIDLITISFAPWNGSPGLLHVFYTLTGETIESGNGNAFVYVLLRAGANTETADKRSWTYDQSTSGIFSIGPPLHFIYGQPFGLDFSLAAITGTAYPSCCNGNFGVGEETGTGFGSADFFNTFVLSGLIPTDLSGNQALGATFSSGSGTQYGLGGINPAQPVPEPSSLLLLAVGAFGMLAKRGHTRHRSSR